MDEKRTLFQRYRRLSSWQKRGVYGLAALVAYTAFANVPNSRQQSVRCGALRVRDFFSSAQPPERLSGLCQSLRNGVILELKPGLGEVFPVLNPTATYAAIDPSSECLEILAQRAQRSGRPSSTLQLTTGSCLDELKKTPSGTFDSVITNQALSSESQPEQVLAEVYRVLKPGGRFLFVEKAALPKNGLLSYLQTLISIPYSVFTFGRRLDRFSLSSVSSAGFTDVYAEQWGSGWLSQSSDAEIRPLNDEEAGGGGDVAAEGQLAGLAPTVAGFATKPGTSLMFTPGVANPRRTTMF